jgi:hypothetical protein
VDPFRTFPRFCSSTSRIPHIRIIERIPESTSVSTRHLTCFTPLHSTFPIVCGVITMATCLQDQATVSSVPARTLIGQAADNSPSSSGTSRSENPFRLQQRDWLAFQLLLAAFLFMAAMNFWNLLSALLR